MVLFTRSTMVLSREWSFWRLSGVNSTIFVCPALRDRLLSGYQLLHLLAVQSVSVADGGVVSRSDAVLAGAGGAVLGQQQVQHTLLGARCSDAGAAAANLNYLYPLCEEVQSHVAEGGAEPQKVKLSNQLRSAMIVLNAELKLMHRILTWVLH